MHLNTLKLSFLVVLTVLFSSNANALDNQKLLDSLFSVIMIQGFNQDGSMAYGSGVVVAPQKVLTNCHIFRQTKQAWVSISEDTYSISSFQANRYHDLCLLTVDDLKIKAVEIGSASTMNKGQEVLAIGHSSGVATPISSSGSLKSVYPFDDGNVIRTTARFAMGASGSGLFDLDGKLIGLNTFKSPGRNAYFYALPIEWLASLEKEPIETEFPVNGKAFWEEDDVNKPFFMQIVEPEIQEDWSRLAVITQKWIDSDSKSSEAWYEHGLSLEHLGNKKEAESDYRQSIMLNKSNSDALFRLGMLASEKGDLEEVKRINLVLMEIDKDIAEEFKASTDCKTQC